MKLNSISDISILTTCPRDCYDTCGIVVNKKNDVIVQVRGDPNHPVSQGKLCKKCSIAYNHEWIDPSARLTQPLRRVGAKGNGEFEPVSWDLACTEIAAKLKDIISKYGSQTIYNAHYTGTISLLAFMFPMRFFNKLGATEVNPDTICNMAGHAALNYMYGTSLNGFDPRMVDNAECIVVWGGNPSASGPHVNQHWLNEAKAKVIVIDPIRTETAEAADIHLQLFPGSDAALVYTMLNVIHGAGLIANDFVKANTVGWDEIEPVLKNCTLAWGEAMTGVPAALIEEAALIYAKGPSLLWMGQALQRQPRGGNIMRACALLPALTGNLAKSGAGFLYLNWDLPLRHIDDAYLAKPHLSSAEVDKISHMDLAANLENVGKCKALFAWNINIAASNPEQARLKKALLREDLFTIALDLFPTDTTDYADYILPAASFLEFNDLVAGYFHLTLSAQVKVTEPMGQALPNQEIFRRLALAMGYLEPELYESDEAILNYLMLNADLGETFSSLAIKGTVPVPKEPIIQFKDLKFSTPSGKIELASSAAEADGHSRIPVPDADKKPKNGYLRLLSPSSSWALNSSFGNVLKIQGHDVEASILMHLEDAKERSVKSGDGVLVSNDTGQLKLIVKTSNNLPRGVVVVHKGRWPKVELQGFNVNVLNSGAKTDMGESSAVHGIEVMVTKLDL
jgi:anaerobic selenocysteine-containing dehydrogenase